MINTYIPKGGISNLKRAILGFSLGVAGLCMVGCKTPVDPKPEPEPTPVITVSGLEGKLNDSYSDIFSDSKSIDCTITVTDGTLTDSKWYDNENNSGEAIYNSGNVVFIGNPNYGPISLKFKSGNVEKLISGLIYSPSYDSVTSVISGGSGGLVGTDYLSSEIESWFSGSTVSTFKDVIKNSKEFYYGFIDSDIDGVFDNVEEYGILYVKDQNDSERLYRVTKSQVDFLNNNHPYNL